jgi:hypothetical protein
MGCTASGNFPLRRQTRGYDGPQGGEGGITLSHSLTGFPSTGFEERYALGVSFSSFRGFCGRRPSCWVGFPPSPSDPPPLGRTAINNAVSPYNLHV